MEILPKDTLAALESLDTCTVSNAIEQFGVRLRNEGFMNSSVHCMFPNRGPKVGYAVTGYVRTASTPVKGLCYYHRLDWWSHVLTVPAPRFIVLKDADHVPGAGALLGDIHATIFVALECAAFVTNGAVRDLPGVQQTGLQVFAGNVAVSHCYAHVTDFGEPIEIAGLIVKPGDLLHGDQHGIQNIPIPIAPEIPGVAAEILHSEKRLKEFCRSPRFSLEELANEINRISKKFKNPGCSPDDF